MKRTAAPIFSSLALLVYCITAWTIWESLELQSDGRYVGELENLLRFSIGGALGLILVIVSFARAERFLWFGVLMLAPAAFCLYPVFDLMQG